jgi:MFS family permease
VKAAKKLRALLQIRWSGQLADGIFQSALATFVLFSPERATSAVSAATAFAVVLLPYSIVGPYVGIFLDRFSRQRIVLIANALRAIDLIIIAILIKSSTTGILLTLFVLIAFGMNRLILAGLSAGLPLLAPRESLISANALAVTGGTIGVVIGGGIGVGIKNIFDKSFASDFSSFLIVLIACVGYALTSLSTSRLNKSDIGPHEHELAAEARGFSEMFEGFRILRAHGDSLRGIIATSVQRAGVTALTLMGLLLERNTYHPSNNPDAGLRGFGTALAVAGVGVGVGSVISPWMVRRIGRHNWIRLALIGPVPFLLLFALYSRQFTFLIAAFTLALFGQAVKVTNDALVQSSIDDEFRGRTFAFYDVAVNIGIMVGALSAALLLPKSGQSALVLVLLAFVSLLTSGFVLRPPQK